MFRAHQQLRCAIPDCDDDFISGEKGLKWLISEASEAEVADFDDAGGGDEDVGGFEVAVEYVGVVKVEKAVEELVD